MRNNDSMDPRNSVAWVYQYHVPFFCDAQGRVWTLHEHVQAPCMMRQLLGGAHTVWIIGKQIEKMREGMQLVTDAHGVHFVDHHAFLRAPAATMAAMGVVEAAVIRWPTLLGANVARVLHRAGVPLTVWWVGFLHAPWRPLAVRWLLRDAAVALVNHCNALRMGWYGWQLRRMDAMGIFNGDRLAARYQPGFRKSHTTINCTVPRVHAQHAQQPAPVSAQVHMNMDANGAPASQPLRLIMVAAFDRHKKLDVMLDAMRLLIARGIPVHLDVIGGYRETVYPRFITLHYLSDTRLLQHVTFHGHVPWGDALWPHYRRADLLVQLATWEGNPRVAMEALALGVPVLTVPVGSLDRLIHTHGVGDLLPDVQPTTLADRIAAIAHHPDQRAAWQCNAQRMASTFTVEAQMQTLLPMIMRNTSDGQFEG